MKLIPKIAGLGKFFGNWDSMTFVKKGTVALKSMKITDVRFVKNVDYSY